MAMNFSGRELDHLSQAYQEWLKRRKIDLRDHDLFADADLLVRLVGASTPGWRLLESDLFAIPWLLPTIRKALRDAGLVPGLRQRITQLELDLKAAKKPAPRPKRRPLKKAPAPAPEPEPALAFPAPRTMEEVNAALGEQP